MEIKIMKTINRVKLRFSSILLMILFSLILCADARADTVKHQVTGLFMKEREQDLREAVAKIPEVKLVSIDFNNAEATFDYAPATAFPGAGRRSGSVD